MPKTRSSTSSTSTRTTTRSDTSRVVWSCGSGGLRIPSHLAELSREFADILVSGTIEIVEPSAAEVADADHVDLVRLALHFDRRSYGRLRALIDRLNRLVATPENVQPPPPFEEEQAERPW